MRKVSYLPTLNSNKVTKAEIVSKIAKKTGISKGDVQLTVEVLLQTIKDAMIEDEKVHFRGFGSFVNKKRGKKVARNIAQNTALIIEEHYVPSFQPAKSLAAEIKAKVKDSV
ncbi:MAG: HU family DNA-binding protein [Bacteroidota bacterium]